jgi:4-hydroxy-tetrahydrodipicolinate synthase
MKELLALRGIVTVLNTPFSAEDTLDLAGLRRNVRAALEAGVAGFLVPAMASEVDRLSAAERRLLVETVLEENAGRVRVIGGASAASAAERLERARELIALGCSGVLVSIPLEDEEGYEREVRRLDSLGPGFLVLQDWDFRGYGLPVSLIARLFEEVASFRCLKVEVVPAGAKYTEVLQATGGRLHVSGGWAVMQMIEALDRGVHAFMPTGLHELYVRIDRLYREGRREQARALFHRLLPVLAFSNQHSDLAIRFFKRLAWRQGIYATARVREPLLPFDAAHERIADELIDYAVGLIRELGGRRSGGEEGGAAGA